MCIMDSITNYIVGLLTNKNSAGTAGTQLALPFQKNGSIAHGIPATSWGSTKMDPIGQRDPRWLDVSHMPIKMVE